MLNRRFIFALLPLLILICGCGFKPLEPKGIEDIKFLKVDALQGIVIFDLGMKINNPNGLAFTLYASELDIKVGSVPLGKVTVNEAVKLKRKTEDLYRVKVNAKLGDLLRNIPLLIKVIAQKQTDVEIKGWIRAGTLGLRKTIPVEINQKQVPTSSVEGGK